MIKDAYSVNANEKSDSADVIVKTKDNALSPIVSTSVENVNNKVEEVVPNFYSNNDNKTTSKAVMLLENINCVPLNVHTDANQQHEFDQTKEFVLKVKLQLFLSTLALTYTLNDPLRDARADLNLT